MRAANRSLSLSGRLIGAFVAALLATTSVNAQVTWDSTAGTSGPQDGSGTWSTVDANWWDGSADVVWPNLTTSSAVIGANSGAAGTITVSGSLAINALTFNAPGSGSYTLTGGTLGFGGTTPTITVNTAAGTVASVLTGSAGLTKSGTGTLILTGVSTYTGTTTVSGGTLQIGNGGTLATIASSPIVNNGNVFYNMNSAGASFTVAPMTGSGNLTATTGGAGNGFIRLGGNITLSGSASISSGVGSLGNQNGIRLSGSTTITASAISLNGNFGSDGNNSNFPLTLDTSAGNGPISIDAYNGMGGHTWPGVSTVIANSGTGAVNIAGAQAGKAGVGSWSATLTGALNISSSYSPGALTLNATAGSSITGNLSLAANSANVWTVSPGVTMAVPGALSGSAAAITKNGTGLLTFTGNNTYTGTTTINSGTLQIGTGSTAGSISGSTVITGSAGGVLAFNRSDNYGGNVSNTIGGGVGLTLSAGTLALTGSNSYTGPTSINAGVLSLGNASAISSSGTISFGGGVLQFTGSNSTDYSSRFSTGANQAYALDTNGQNVTIGTALTSSGGSLRKLGSGTLTLTAASTYTGTTSINAGTLQIGNGSTTGSLASSIAITGSSGSLLVFNRTDNYGGNFANPISGGVGLTLSTGTLTLTATNTYTGTTTINAGARLVSGTGGTAGSLATTAIVNNGDLIYNLVSDGATTVSLPAGITGSGNLSVSGGRIQFNGNITQGGSQTYTQTNPWPNSMRMTANTTLTGSAITMSGLLGQDLNNSYVMSLDTSAANGPISLALTIGQAGRYYGINAFTANSGTGTLSMTGNPAVWSVNTTTLTGGLNIASTLSPAPANSGSTTALNLNATAASSVSGNMTFGANTTNTWSVSPGVTMAVSGILSGSGASLTKNGTGLLTFTGNNTYTGTTTINSGTLQIGTGSTAGSISGSTAITGSAGGVLAFNRSDNYGGNFANTIDGGLGLTLSAGTLTLTAANTYSGVTTINAGVLQIGSSGRLGGGTYAANIANNGTLVYGGTNAQTLAGAMSGSGGLTMSGSGTLTLTGNNTFTGPTTISGGTLSVGNGGTSGALAGNVVNNAALIFNRSNDSIYAGNIAGSGGLTKLGAGKLTLTGSSSFAGPATVSNGMLAVNGQVASSVAVGNGAFLGGSGLVGGVLSGAGIVSPGNSPGILTAGQFDPSGGLDAAFEFTAAAPVYTSATASLNDVLRLTNASPFTTSLAGGNAIDVYFDVSSIAAGAIFEGGFFTGLSAGDLLSAVQGASFNYWVRDNAGGTVFNGVNYSSLASVPGITGVTLNTISRTADFGSGSVSGSVTQFVIVPEPSTIVFAGIGIAMAGWSLRNRRRIAS
jgi:fibronectin-binding autotransporter adhesin